MRLLLALAYIGTGCWLYATLSSRFGAAKVPVFYVVFFGLIFSSVLLLNKGLIRKLKRQSLPAYLAELEARGKLVRANYSATRAMCCEDLSTGCSACFIDAGANGTVLLYGQDMSYVPMDDDGNSTGPRTFPTENFSLLRKRGEVDVLDIEASGAVIEPEDFGEPPPSVLYSLGIKLMDGAVFLEPSYDSIRGALAAANNSFKPTPLRGSA